jgi:hypothetical protein
MTSFEKGQPILEYNPKLHLICEQIVLDVPQGTSKYE